MTISTAINIAQKLKKYEPFRVEFAMRGEPTLNHNWLKIIQIFRTYLQESSIMITTNGSRLNKKNIHQFFKNGGNVILVDCYNKDLEKRKKEWKQFKPVDYYNDDFNPYHRHTPSTKKVVLMDNIMKRNHDKKTRVISNHAGNVDYQKIKKYGVKPLKKPLKKKCVRPFREMIVLYNGDVILCCADSGSEFKLGNLNKHTVEQIWFKNKKLNLARLLLFNKSRTFKPCNRCDFNGGMRQGLIPKMKKLTPKQAKEYTKEVILLFG
jgi:radical SAM protein with 4Fe4S-binding SPASM domain